MINLIRFLCAISIFFISHASSATMLFIGNSPQKIYSNKDGGWIYKYRVRVTNDSVGRIPHILSVKDATREEVPFSSSKRKFIVNGTNPVNIDVFIKSSDLNKKTIICAISDYEGPRLGSCTYLPGS